MARGRTPIVFSLLDVRESSEAARLALRHQKVLRANGFPTRVVNPTMSERSLWIDEETPLERSDPAGEFIRVVAASDLERVACFGPKVVLAGGVDPNFQTLDSQTWKACGVEAVVAVSRWLKAAVEDRFGIPTTVISPSVDKTLFSPAQKQRFIAFFDDEGHFGIGRILEHYRPQGYALVSIEGQSPAKIGQILSHASIFLAGNRSEGFSLSALEAMASGCLVVGFSGKAGHDFMEDGSNCLLSPEGDYEQAAELLESAVRMTDEKRTFVIVQEAIRTARQFSPGREAAEIMRFWGSYLDGHSLR